MVCGIYIIIMEDYILREIDKIGKLIEALCRRRASCGEAGRESRLRNRLDGVGGGARSGYRHSAGPGGLYRRADPRVWLQRREPGKIRRAAVRFRGRFARSGRDGPARLRHYGHLPLSGRKEGSGFPEPLLHPQGVGEYDCPIARCRRTVVILVCAG